MLSPNGNVKDIVVQVQRSEELAKGDIVTVKIPASLIPLRNFKVTTTEAGSTMEIGGPTRYQSSTASASSPRCMLP